MGNIKFNFLKMFVLGVLGEKCEINIDDCTEESCENGGTCEDGINSYSCNCIEGFEGSSKIHYSNDVKSTMERSMVAQWLACFSSNHRQSPQCGFNSHN